MAASWRLREKVAEAGLLVVYDALGGNALTESACEELGRKDPNLGELAYCLFLLVSYEGEGVWP